MKKNTLPFIVTFFVLSILLCACGSGELNKKAETTANDFYKNLQNKDYIAALNLCSNKAFTVNTKDDWTFELKKNASLLGEMKSFTKTSDFNIATSTSIGTTVTLAYDVQWQYGKSTDSFILIKESDGNMKIYRYQWLYKDAKFLNEVTESEQKAHQYMDDLKSNNYDAAISLCSNEALKITPKEKWAAFLTNAANKMGNVSDYSIIKDSSDYHINASGGAGIGNYYNVFVLSNRGGHKVMEKIVFFQKNFDMPVKVTGHDFL